MNSPANKLKELTHSIERYERRSRKRAIIYSLIIPAILLISYFGFGVLLIKKLENKKAELETQINQQQIKIEQQQTNIKDLDNYAKKQREEISKLEARFRNLLPSSITIYLAMKVKSQEDIAQSIKNLYLKKGVPSEKIRIVPDRRGDPPYTTEVRYFNYPKDLDLAQSMVFILQKDYNIVLSRTSLVRDQRPNGTIEIHLSKRL